MAGLLEFACEVTAQAGALILAGAFRAHGAATKRNANDLVTEYDRRSEALIVSAIRARFPDDRILCEESGEHAGSGARRWLIDPLDGTTNFAHGLPFFCISIAAEEAGETRAGVVAAPALGWTFAAERGRGAWLEAGGVRRALAVSTTDTLERALLATGFPTDNATNPENNFAAFLHLYRRTQGVRRMGAAALDLAMTAAGWFDGYWERRLKPWDLAAGALLVTEAGGRVTATSGELFRPDLGEAVATNGHIHDELIAELARAAG